jgi:hypothetical protein
MATWKEVGCVPDSDDEGDLDTQSQAVSVHSQDDEFHGIDELMSDKNDSLQQIPAEDGLFARTDGTPLAGNIDGMYTRHDLPVSEESTPMAGVEDSAVSMSSSPRSRSFQVPYIYSQEAQQAQERDRHDFINRATSQEAQRPVDIHPAQDEISKSYVQLASAASSSLSSLSSDSSMLADLPGFKQQPHVWSCSTDELAGTPRNVQQESINHDDNPISDITHATIANGRSLRKRTLIQEKPFSIEYEKYRQTVQARGLKPVRLEVAQEVAREWRIHRLQDTSQEHPSSLDEESQFVNEEGFRIPTSSLPNQTSDEENDAQHAGFDNDADLDDDDLPDLTELLHGRHGGGLHFKKRRIANSDSLQGKRRRLSAAKARNDINIWDIPPSPPATSSPLLKVTPRGVTSETPASLSTLRSRLNSLEQEPWDRTPAQPASVDISKTNRDGQLVDLTDLTSDSEDDSDGSGSQGPSSPSLSASETESKNALQRRREGKKVRGVLPASWFNLNRETLPTTPMRPSHRMRSLSPAKTQPRRGVAVPKITPKTIGSTTTRSMPRNLQDSSRLSFLSDESESEDETGTGHSAGNMLPDLDFGSIVSGSQDLGAIEDDRVDAMLPSRKRQSVSQMGGSSRKRRRVGSSMFMPEGQHQKHQPMITDTYTSTSKRESAARTGGSTEKRSIPTKSRKSRRPRQPRPSRLGILDAPNVLTDLPQLPKFIRIAVRTARSRKDLGRHSPQRKYIRLSNRDDTRDANLHLNQWRESSLVPNPIASDLRRVDSPKISTPRFTSSTSESHARRRPISASVTPFSMPRKIVVSKPRQTKLTFDNKDDLARQKQETDKPRAEAPSVNHQPKLKSYRPIQARPAQLEALEDEYIRRHPSRSFGSSKRTLDSMYKRLQQVGSATGGPQISRYLAHNVAVPVQSHPAKQLMIEQQQGASNPSGAKPKGGVVHRPRKRTPVRLDVGRSWYRQPDEPIAIASNQEQEPMTDDKLQGLGKYGTKYTSHFDILPLDSSIFFHESTFIGGNRLWNAINIASSRDFEKGCQPSLYSLEEKQFRWSTWNDFVSSEFGLCLDWILDLLEMNTEARSSSTSIRELEALSFLIKYVQDSLNFSGNECRLSFITRAVEVLHCFIARLKIIMSGEKMAESKVAHQVLAQSCVLTLQTILIAREASLTQGQALKLETILQDAAGICMMLLMRTGTEQVRRIYEDFQSLHVREAGIRDDQYIVESWVIIIRVLVAAKIPRGSFWDVFNSLVSKNSITGAADARTLEKRWYDMFSMLPLTQFDASGMLSTVGPEHIRSSLENWMLPQKLIKEVFALYAKNNRQPAGFNEYCRAIFRRCHHLIMQWSWRHCGGIVGALFDFFASEKLAHLRNEEVYSSPKFLENLAGEPSLDVTEEDCCFHILLKIVATTIKQMREAGDHKGIRNLITRLLPNHDRQYPKERAIYKRDLASLRNHHDLLCTLFWAAPPDLRPSLTLLRDLVAPDRSHQEACLINLHAWSHVATFLVVEEYHRPTIIKSLFDWHRNVHITIVSQLELATREANEHVSHLNNTTDESILDHVRHVTKSNKASATITLRESYLALSKAITMAQSVDAAAEFLERASCESFLASFDSIYER